MPSSPITVEWLGKRILQVDYNLTAFYKEKIQKPLENWLSCRSFTIFRIANQLTSGCDPKGSEQRCEEFLNL
jgi:hypothetical protein